MNQNKTKMLELMDEIDKDLKHMAERHAIDLEDLTDGTNIESAMNTLRGMIMAHVSANVV